MPLTSMDSNDMVLPSQLPIGRKEDLSHGLSPASLDFLHRHAHAHGHGQAQAQNPPPGTIRVTAE